MFSKKETWPEWSESGKWDEKERFREVTRASCASAVVAADDVESSLELLPAREREREEQMESCGARRGTVTACTVW